MYLIRSNINLIQNFEFPNYEKQSQKQDRNTHPGISITFLNLLALRYAFASVTVIRMLGHYLFLVP